MTEITQKLKDDYQQYVKNTADGLFDEVEKGIDRSKQEKIDEGTFIGPYFRFEDLFEDVFTIGNESFKMTTANTTASTNRTQHKEWSKERRELRSVTSSDVHEAEKRKRDWAEMIQDGKIPVCYSKPEAMRELRRRSDYLQELKDLQSKHLNKHETHFGDYRAKDGEVSFYKGHWDVFHDIKAEVAEMVSVKNVAGNITYNLSVKDGYYGKYKDSQKLQLFGQSSLEVQPDSATRRAFKTKFKRRLNRDINKLVNTLWEQLQARAEGAKSRDFKNYLSRTTVSLKDTQTPRWAEAEKGVAAITSAAYQRMVAKGALEKLLKDPDKFDGKLAGNVFGIVHGIETERQYRGADRTYFEMDGMVEFHIGDEQFVRKPNMNRTTDSYYKTKYHLAPISRHDTGKANTKSWPDFTGPDSRGNINIKFEEEELLGAFIPASNPVEGN